MKSWLITWVWSGEHAAVEDPIVAILSARNPVYARPERYRSKASDPPSLLIRLTHSPTTCRVLPFP